MIWSLLCAIFFYCCYCCHILTLSGTQLARASKPIETVTIVHSIGILPIFFMNVRLNRFQTKLCSLLCIFVSLHRIQNAMDETWKSSEQKKVRLKVKKYVEQEKKKNEPNNSKCAVCCSIVLVPLWPSKRYVWSLLLSVHLLNVGTHSS